MGDVQTGDAVPAGIDIHALSEFEFEEVATSVEERFRRVYDGVKAGTAKVESQMEYELVSSGWWLVIKRLGLALWIGKDKPAIESGDVLRITIRKKPGGHPASG
ncbi:hypothetical protein I6F35_06495 [Bradyrhizobium sp. BRP22]|uniref:hypothetical protein n=1 Tax=Bradyrhizobium sp. BRP22 TaxID=2793821 RepID=UPI001CD20789|nr:hypothetical protein [Bradyrhizobium sp. BRP22]MCA1452870.1 hypothetical protein [Bradyrhizobium sp. BRP22]